ncbi:ComEC family protein [Enterobacter sp. ENT03]|uniref:ComEC family protein n=1 Tax=Enterobacter sp. ENT03 TaxID=2854780 RepID=UPI001C467E45|nr:ComEC family protein [Enterobacter sp. ENT03]MBV7403644.1 ComEC family protein [Enterobacter sp. ENT03]
MHLPGIALCLLTAMAPLLWLPRLPGLMTVIVIIVAGCVAGCCRDRRLAYTGLWLLFMAWGMLAAKEAVWPTQHLPGRIQQAQIRLIETDNITTHRGVIEQLNGKRLWPAPGITLYGEYLPQPACAGQLWEMELKIRPVHGQLNDGGFDTQRYSLATHQPLTGRFSRASVIHARCSLRAEYLASLSDMLENLRWRSVLLALGMGERTILDAQVKAVMRQTGTAHLMAISGLHIALAATLGWLLARGVQFWLPGRWINWRAPLLVGLFCATGYAWLTGLQPPALRTVVSLGVLVALRLSGRQWSAWQVWLCCIAAILFIDPIAVLSQSLWLSAFAVAALIFWYQWLPLPVLRGGKMLSAAISLIYLQTGMMMLLLPLQVALFHGISLTSIIANLVAVPLVTFVSVPLILAAMLLHLTAFNALEGWIWARADDTLALLFGFLNALPEGWYNIDWRWQWLVFAPWLLIVIWRLGLWKTAPFLCTATGMLLAQPLWKSTPRDNWSVYMLDVGQGLAMVIARHDKAILYDTGLAWPGGDSAQQLIVPWLRWHHLKPEGIILSHEHLDHRGGLNTLHETWPEIWIRSPLDEAGHLPCFRGERWQWQGLTFSVHWPLSGTSSHGNNRSCVVKVDDGKNSILLTGDIEASAEQSMLSHYWQHLQATIIQVPHHGSSTSSSLPLLQRAGGHAALASASRFNAWRLPSEKVIRRYRHQGYEWFDTPHQGQISIHFSAEGWEILGLRDQLFPRWYHQWFGVPVDNR